MGRKHLEYMKPTWRQAIGVEDDHISSQLHICMWYASCDWGIGVGPSPRGSDFRANHVTISQGKILLNNAIRDRSGQSLCTNYT